ncbi:PDZ domain-containing protein [Opitutus sp. ER46]|uniref:PDZ domain-containing protein n=1 Tax=Opitutus sp. ER46 TaxID=2161864 RepID=UPI000D30E430|nr:PDZ domain-containing protein [Opitutus sp. ER46]PTX94529.1 signal protein PDZ [Opitutus sp. ER46]
MTRPLRLSLRSSSASPRRFPGLRPGLLWVAVVLGLAPLARAADIPALFAERAKCVVAVEYVTETEVERRPTITMGTVIDTEGTIILQSGAIDSRAAIWQLKDFRVYPAGEGTSTPAEYLGQDAFTGWHFVRVGAGLRSRLTPVTAFAKPAAPAPGLADFLWGIGLRNKDEDFLAYVMQSHLAMVAALPQRTGIAQQEVAAPGLPVFDREGTFVGLAASSFGQSYLQFGRGGRAQPVTLINIEESSAFYLASEVLPYLQRIPKSITGRPLAWLGTFGLEAMDRDVAKFLNLGGQSGVVVSEVLEGSPAEKAGLRARDIILAIDGAAVPQLKPNAVIPAYLEREIERRRPGDTMVLAVLRGAERVTVSVVLGEEPKLLREAERKYFDRLGVTAREFVYGDAVVRRVKASEQTGVIVHYVKSSSAAATAGLREDDWIREIDGAEVKDFAAAVQKLGEIERDLTRPEFVLLVSRGNETAVLRVKLK